MARRQRTPHHDPFSQDDFNAQMYRALQRSPWWLTSILIHVLAFGALLAMGTSEAAEPPAPLVTVSAPPPDLDLEPEDIQQVDDTPIPLPVLDEPSPADDLLPDPPEDDNDLPFNEKLGEQTEFPSAGVSQGPATNSVIGLAGGGGSPFGRRGGDNSGGKSGSGNARTDDALDNALEWLAMHQSPNGAWGAEDFANWYDGRPVPAGAEKPDGRGKAHYDVGVTGLALCAFLGAGYTNRGTHKYNRVVGRGLRYLKNVQDPEGCFGARSTQQYIYSHATASLAMVEAYGMTGSPIFRGSAQRALDFISLTRNPYLAWRYGIKPGDNDTSVTGWMMMALKSAMVINKSVTSKGRPAPLTIDAAAYDGIKAWLAKVTDPDTGRVGYLTRGTGSARPPELLDRFPADKTEAMTAVGVLARTFAGEDPRKSDVIRKGADRCTEHLPTWDDAGSVDMYYWYYGTLAMFQVGGTHWSRWNARIEPAMVDTQRSDGTFQLYKGSWDPVGPWGADGGRVYSTAMMAMCLEVFYRYDRVFTGDR